MSYILVENLTKTFGDRTILNNISFSIDEGEKVALVARNGMGKSTLLNILMGKEDYDDGKITKQKGVKTAFLDQDPQLNSDKTAIEEIFSSESPIINAVKLYEDSLANPDDMDKMQLAYDEMEKNNAWEVEKKIHEVLEKLNIHNLNQKISKFSGGQKKRVALAKILIDPPDLLVMDEPTNHLDLEMIDWIEEYLEDQKITLLLVTHDRYFLERVCNEIIELDHGKIYKYKGNYSYFLEMKATRELNENINIDKTRSLLKKELEWVRKSPRGRQSKGKARVDAYNDKKENLQEKKIVEKVKLDIVGRYMGSKILEIHNLTKSFGEKKILDKFTYSFNKGEKVGIIGKNGVGKTTFLNILMEKENFDSGKIIKGESVQFGYYSQENEKFTSENANEKIIDSVKKVANYIKLADGTEISASKMLERFLFPARTQQSKVSELSGGELKRLNLLKILMQNPNFLILDEPTNDLDIMTLNVLEEFLIDFKGCLIIITHDRYFMDKIVSHLFVFEGNGKIKDFPGSYSIYRENKEELESTEQENIPTENENKQPEKPKNSKEANELLKEIKKLEEKKSKLNEKMFKSGLSYEEISKLSLELKEVEQSIEDKTEKWIEIG